MGSSYSNLYSGTKERSQPFKTYYHVVDSMHKYDIETGAFKDGKYLKNPTAQNIHNMINGEYIGSKSYTNDALTYVITKDNQIIVGKRNGNGRGKDSIPTPHPSLIGGEDPKVRMAGILHIENGKIVKYDDRSGHYKPNKKSMKVADEVFGKLPKYLFKNGG